MRIGDLAVLDRSGLDTLLSHLRARGYRTLGPVVRDGAVVYDEVQASAEFPRGVRDEQGPGRYRLVRDAEPTLFGYGVPAQSWKRFLHPPEVTLWRARRRGRGFEVEAAEEEAPPLAFVGVRPCELAAIRVLDGVLLGGAHPDVRYRARRRNSFLVAANCTRAGGTCFCASLGTGPRAAGGFDLALTEIPGPAADPPELLLEVGSDEGAAAAAALPRRPAEDRDRAAAEEAVARAGASMGRSLPQAGLAEALSRSLEEPRWDEVGARCLACANCTMVCPTCFCTTVLDVTDLAGEQARRERQWDSCFGLDYSYIHGGAVRTTAGARYRQWLLHKLATWHAQFGSAGCVGCGRCITWCPVGIDITEEAAAVRAAAEARSGGPGPPGTTTGGPRHGD
jgi:ferredoxin